MLALADLRTPEQIEADDEIEQGSRDEPDDLIRSLQDAIAACSTFFDLWTERNNLPAPPCPGHLAQELAGRDLVAEESVRIISHQVIVARRSRKVELHVLSTDRQMSLL